MKSTVMCSAQRRSSMSFSDMAGTETATPGRLMPLWLLIRPAATTSSASEDVGALSFDGACLRSNIDSDHLLGYELMRRFARLAIRHQLGALTIVEAMHFGLPVVAYGATALPETVADALNRIRFEHPEVRSVIVTSARDRIFCSGANIFMLGVSSHAWKVNFCKFTNETRNGIEDSSRHSGLKFIAACNGTTAGGGYELALACDEILLVDDGNSAVSLPETPLLAVLPGTGGLTRVVDKRKVRRDLADFFGTVAEGIKGKRAVEWRLVDAVYPTSQFKERVARRAKELAATSDRPAEAAAGVVDPEQPTHEHVGGAVGRHRGAAADRCGQVTVGPGGHGRPAGRRPPARVAGDRARRRRR